MTKLICTVCEEETNTLTHISELKEYVCDRCLNEYLVEQFEDLPLEEKKDIIFSRGKNG